MVVETLLEPAFLAPPPAHHFPPRASHKGSVCCRRCNWFSRIRDLGKCCVVVKGGGPGKQINPGPPYHSLFREGRGEGRW